MYLATKAKIDSSKCTAISKHIYKAKSIKGIDLPKDTLIFRKINTKKARIGARRIKPSFNLMILDPTLYDKSEIRRELERSLAIKIFPFHFIFPNIDYESVNYKKIHRPSEIRKKRENTTIITSLHPANSYTQSTLREIALQNATKLKDKIKKSCIFTEKGKIERNEISKKISDLKTRLKILKTKCQVYSLFFGINLEREYMKAYLAFNGYRKSCERLLGTIK